MIEFKISDFDYYQDHKLLIAKDWKMLDKHIHKLWSGKPDECKFVIQGKRKMTFVQNNRSKDWEVVYKVWPAATGIYPYYGEDAFFIAAFIQHLNMDGQHKLPPRQTPML